MITTILSHLVVISAEQSGSVLFNLVDRMVIFCFYYSIIPFGEADDTSEGHWL